MHSFQSTLINWYSSNGRNFPWRKTRDPYKILVAEIMIRKTGACKAQSTYNEIINQYPSPSAMGRANLMDLRQKFKRLGISTRADTLINIAQIIESKYNNIVPRSRNELIDIDGIGTYIANAVLCFGYNMRFPILDGSINRFFCRYFGLISSKSYYSDEKLWSFAASLLPYRRYRQYNLGLLDYCATVCKSNQPLCTNCLLVKSCSNLKGGE